MVICRHFNVKMLNILHLNAVKSKKKLLEQTLKAQKTAVLMLQV